MDNSSQFLSEKVLPIGNKYNLLVRKKLGGGTFGDLYIGFTNETYEKIAIKCESNKKHHLSLKYESGVLKYLQKGIGIPEIYEYIQTKNYNFIVMQLLGPSLEELFELCERKFNLKTILLLSEQMINRIEYMHTRHIIHRDIKPDNFLMGDKNNTSILYICDFGLAKRFRNPVTGEHIPYKSDKSLTGTARYASIYSLMGIEQSRRDDLESLVYCILYFSLGELPWQGIKAKNKTEKYEKILEKKVITRMEELSKKLPEDFISFMQYIRDLQFEEKPNYNFLKGILSKIYNKFNFEYDLKFDFIKILEDKKKKENEEFEQFVTQFKIYQKNNENQNEIKKMPE